MISEILLSAYIVNPYSLTMLIANGNMEHKPRPRQHAEVTNSAEDKKGSMSMAAATNTRSSCTRIIVVMKKKADSSTDSELPSS